jgi:hypothetical protein
MSDALRAMRDGETLGYVRTINANKSELTTSR